MPFRIEYSSVQSVLSGKDSDIITFTSFLPHIIESRSRASSSLLMAGLACAMLLMNTRSACAQAAVPSISDRLAGARQLRAQGELDAAFEILVELDALVNNAADNSAEAIDLSLDLAIAARDATAAGKTERALLLCERTLASLKRDAARNLPNQTVAIIRLTLASSYSSAGKPGSAADVMVELFGQIDTIPPKSRKTLVELALKVGWDALVAGDALSAEKVYGGLHGIGDRNASSLLGHAWSVSMQEGRDAEAADLLQSFIDTFPDHTDTPRAIALQIHCLTKSGNTTHANLAFATLLKRAPYSPVTVELIRGLDAGNLDAGNLDAGNLDAGDTESSERYESAWAWIAERLREDDGKKVLTPQVLSFGLFIHATSTSPDIQADLETWDLLVARLNRTDKSGQAISDLLGRLRAPDQQTAVEQIAMWMIDQKSKPPSERNPKAAEAACRWAGRTQRWTLLALAATDSSPESADAETRSIAVERLYAEALMQTGQSELADRWWRHLVDIRGAADFATLLRCAETVGMFGTTAEAAERIAAARNVADKESSQIALVNFLESELAIRNLDFDAARSHLEQIVRGADSPQSLRGRAQWMIGETHFLQQKFAKAINEYRKVEGMDPGGDWIATSLVQAGKSFEQLGRTREATICYSDLITRFPQSRHASVGRNRLAAIAPEQTGNQSADDASIQSIQR